MSGFLFAAVAATALSSIQVHGHVSFWSQTCSADGNCSLPRAVAEPILVEGDVARPEAGHVGAFTKMLDAGGTKLKLQVLWRADAGDDQHYLIYQANLNDAETGRFIALCSYYEMDDYASYFPVGACSGPGTFPAEGGGYTVIGTSFTRH